jgi:hypothetical protein
MEIGATMNSGITAPALALLLLITAVSPNPAKAQDNSPSNPAAIGSPVRSMIELGSNYDIVVTLLETVRGMEAMERLKAASEKNVPPKAGFEYVLAHVKFEMKGRTVADNRAFDLGSLHQWFACSAELAEYEGISVTVPKPEMTGRVLSGQSVDGWIAFAVEPKESKPLMAFDPDAGGASGRGKTLFFKLY